MSEKENIKKSFAAKSFSTKKVAIDKQKSYRMRYM